MDSARLGEKQLVFQGAMFHLHQFELMFWSLLPQFLLRFNPPTSCFRVRAQCPPPCSRSTENNFEMPLRTVHPTECSFGLLVAPGAPYPTARVKTQESLANGGASIPIPPASFFKVTF